ncbi:unnamed protein product [Spirodela intermedia]|uniref:Nudix hydrolase domain-containing protein n=1 Tax=Spirodela intermedia TaxID=51605 RepID=A0A7I8JD79_SPIIN|nr:unnamed protein product [Spirodela intermedia]CAA6668118.1 unnamed protein product [Spirodela intermedia]
MSVEARTGREHQLYEDGCRLVAGGGSFSTNSDESPSVEDNIEVLMISSPNRKDLGGWEKDETKREAAYREALEEAGIKGTIHEQEQRDQPNPLGTCKCHFFAMEVKEELDSWPEQAYHERRWLSVGEARELCRYPWMREALQRCVEFLETQTTPASELSSCAKKPKFMENILSTGAKPSPPNCMDNVLSNGTVLCSSS